MGHGLTRVPVDPFEIEREAVIAMLDRERRSLPASLIAISLLAIGVTMLPNVLPMLVLLALRTLSFLYTRQAAARLERIMRARQPARAAHCVMIFAMALTGMTLALMLWPQPEGSSVVAITLIGGVVVVALTLIAVTLAALPRSRDAMLASFWLTALAMTISARIPTSSGC